MVSVCFVVSLFLASISRSADASAVLMSLLKDVQSEAKEGKRLQGAAAKWCQAALHQKTGMAEAIQGELDDAATAARQVQYDANRLSSELSLAESTQKQREQQLKDASSTGNIANQEFTSHARHLDTTMKAAKYALAYFKKQNQEANQVSDDDDPDGTKDSVSNLIQLPGSLLTEKERTVMATYLNDQRDEEYAPSAEDETHELLRTLSEVNTRLQQERDKATQEHATMKQQLWSLTDHLNSSIMEIASQAASIRMEMAQRNREHTRLNSHATSLTGLLAKVKASHSATNEVCADKEEMHTEIARYAADEAETLRSVMKKVPLESSELLADIAQSPTFLQTNAAEKQTALRHVLRGLRHMANKFPEESAWFVNAEHQLDSGSQAATGKHHGRHHAFLQTKAGAESKNASSSIQSIEQFVEGAPDGTNADKGTLPGEERLLLRDSGELAHVKGLYGNLLWDAQVKEKGVSDQRKWCASILRDAKVDGDAVSRSLKRTHAKLNLVKEATEVSKKSVESCKEQQEAIKKQLEELHTLSDSEEQDRESAVVDLSEHYKQLESLAADLSQRPSKEDHHAGELVRGVTKKVQQHKLALQQWAKKSEKKFAALRSTDSDLIKALSEERQRSNKRLVWLKAEAQALSAFAHSKANDVLLSGRYLTLSNQLCSKDHTALLMTQQQRLHEEIRVLEKFMASLNVPYAQAEVQA